MFKPRRESYSKPRRSAGKFSDSRPRRERRDRGGYGSRDREDRPSFEATCAKCHNACLVPFKPTGSKPVLCKFCFKHEDGGSPKSGFRDRPPRERSMVRSLEREDRGPASSNVDAKLKQIEKKLDDILDILRAANIMDADGVEEEQEENEPTQDITFE